MKRILGILLCLFELSLAGQGFDGEVGQISYYDYSGDRKENFNSIWYYPSENTYLIEEQKAFDDRKIAYRIEEFQMIADDMTIEVLEEIGIFRGLMRGYFYAPGTAMEEEQVQETFIAYLGVDVEMYNVRVQFEGVFRRYMLNYTLEPPKHKGYAIFRIPSEAYEEDEHYMIEAKKDRTRLTVTAYYNHQKLTLIITRREAFIPSLLRKAGLNRKSLPLIPEA